MDTSFGESSSDYSAKRPPGENLRGKSFIIIPKTTKYLEEKEQNDLSTDKKKSSSSDPSEELSVTSNSSSLDTDEEPQDDCYLIDLDEIIYNSDGCLSQLITSGVLNKNLHRYEYKKLKMIGKGELSIVWKCKNTYTDQIFAMKVISRSQNRFLTVNSIESDYLVRRIEMYHSAGNIIEI